MFNPFTIRKELNVVQEKLDFYRQYVLKLEKLLEEYEYTSPEESNIIWEVQSD